MRFSDPLNVQCPACRAEFPAALKWIRQSGRSCPSCGADLSSVTDSIQKTVNGWIDLCNRAFIACEIEIRFTVEFTEDEMHEWFKLSDLVEATYRLLKSNGREVIRAELLAATASIIHDLSGIPAESIGPETEFSSFRNVSLMR